MSFEQFKLERDFRIKFEMKQFNYRFDIRYFIYSLIRSSIPVLIRSFQCRVINIVSP